MAILCTSDWDLHTCKSALHWLNLSMSTPNSISLDKITDDGGGLEHVGLVIESVWLSFMAAEDKGIIRFLMGGWDDSSLFGIDSGTNGSIGIDTP